MLSNHGFRANERMYKKRISDWDLRRNLNRNERDAVCNLINVHGEKNMTVIVRGQPRKLTLFQRNLRQASRAAKSPAHLTSPVMLQGQVVLRTIRATTYPPSNRQILELICKQILYASEVDSNGLSHFRPREDNLWNLINLAARHVEERRYADACQQLNSAGEWLFVRMKGSPAFVLISVIECLPVHKLGLNNSPNVLELFYRHAEKLSQTVLGPNHPLSLVLAQLPGLHDWASIAESAHRVALDTIRRRNLASTHRPVMRFLQSCLTYILLDAGKRDNAGVEELIAKIVEQCKAGLEIFDRAERLLQEMREVETDFVSGLAYPYPQFPIPWRVVRLCPPPKAA